MITGTTASSVGQPLHHEPALKTVTEHCAVRAPPPRLRPRQAPGVAFPWVSRGPRPNALLSLVHLPPSLPGSLPASLPVCLPPVPPGGPHAWVTRTFAAHTGSGTTCNGKPVRVSEVGGKAASVQLRHTAAVPHIFAAAALSHIWDQFGGYRAAPFPTSRCRTCVARCW